MTRRIRLGMLTPSSNTVLEPLKTAMLARLPKVTVGGARKAAAADRRNRTAGGADQ